MQKLFSIVLLVCGLSACGDSNPKKDTSPPIITPDQFAQLRDTIEDDLADNKAVAVSVAIYKGGEIVFAEAFGETLQGTGALATSNTLFQLGSTTKMFTGLATLQLVQQGILKTDDKLVNILPDIQYSAAQALSWQDVSIQHLLTHQSGLSDSYFGGDSNSVLLEYMASTYPEQNQQMNPPGLFHNYSNPNWSYLGAIIEHQTGVPYAEHMERNIFEPLGMQRTTMQRSRLLNDGDYALGFQTDGTEDIILRDIEQIPLNPHGLPAGSETWSTPSEQLKMAEFLLNGNTDILSNQLRTEITAPQVNVEFAGLPWHYGYGMFIDDGFMYEDQWYAEKVWQHGGNTTAYTSLFWILPEKNIAVSIMSSGAFNDFEASMFAALNAVTELSEAQAIPYGHSSPADYEKHEGNYNTDQFSAIISQDNGQLMVSIPGFDSNNIPYDKELTAIGDTTFVGVINNQSLIITFLPTENSEESVYLRSRNVVGIKDGY